jgi:hypothetical protein
LDTIPALILPGQRNIARHPIGSFPIRIFFAAEHSGIWPTVHVRAVVGPVHDEGVVGNAEVIQSPEDRADVLVMIDHGIVVRALETPRLPDALRLGMGAEVHVGEVHPDEERLVRIFLAPDEVHGPLRDVVVDRQHALPGQGAGILAYLLAHLSEAWINRCVVLIRGFAIHDAARPILRPKRGVLGVIRQFGFFLGLQVIEVAVELVEAMHGGQELVAVAKVVLAKLAGGIAERLEQFSNCRIFFL